MDDSEMDDIESVRSPHREGQAKFWLEPKLELALHCGLRESRLRRALRLIREHEDEIRTAWEEHFGR